MNQLPQLDGKINKNLLKIPRAWLYAAESTQDTVRQLTEQLRRFLADREREGDRRVLALAHSIQRHITALDGRRDLPGIELEVPEVNLALPMERRLYMPPERAELDSAVDEATDEADVDVSELSAGLNVDDAALAGHVLALLAESPSGQASLETVLDRFPLTLGLAELLTYFQLQRPGLDVVIDPERCRELVYERVNSPEHRGDGATGDLRAQRGRLGRRRGGTGVSDTLSVPIVHLLKAGVLYQSDAPAVWEQITAHQTAIGATTFG